MGQTASVRIHPLILLECPTKQSDNPAPSLEL